MVDDWKKYHVEKLVELDPNKREEAVLYLKGLLREALPAIREMEQQAPQDWWGPYHHGWGTAIRNALRTNGFGETSLGVKNLDDYYIALIEEAIKP